MSSCPERALFATGSYSRTIFVFDSRQDKPIQQYRPHTGAVIKLAMNSEYILSASKDKTVSVWDQRAGRIMKSITVISSRIFKIEKRGHGHNMVYLLDFRGSVPHMRERASRLGLHRGQYCKVAPARSKE